MLYLRLDRVEPGMILGKSLISSSGRALLHAGVELRSVYIEKIRQHGFPGIYIDDEFSKDIVVKDVIPEQLRQKMVKDIKSFFKGLEKESLSAASIAVQHLKRSVSEIIDQIIESQGAISNIVDLKNHDEYTFQHSVNVAVVSIILGVALGYDREWLLNLGMAALFHDVGKTKIPLNILNKPGKLTEDEFDEMKKHSRYGYDYIKSALVDLPAIVYVSVLEHHEKYDGGGYPEGVSGEGILVQARIIAVADVYDAVTSRRPYSTPMEPADAFDLIVSGSSIHFDPEIVSVFTRTIAPYPVGTLVNLSDGRRGIVAVNHNDCILRPLVKILPEYVQSPEAEYADLKNDMNLMSVTILGVA